MSFMTIQEKLNDKIEHLCVWKEPDGYMMFDTYFSNDKCRIFIITNIVHNYLWLKQNLNNIRDTDYFLIYHWWYHDDNLTRQSSAVIDSLKLNKDRFIPLCNDYKELQHFLYYGFKNAIQFNQNAWLDENLIKIIPSEKIYDAILISRVAPEKRIHLANKVDNLAFLTTKQNFDIPLPNHKNEKINVPYNEVCGYINQSKCGLILSGIEGACYASSEYLLSGVPVVSTKSFGSRDLWYTEENSIICEDNEESVKEAVLSIISKKIDPYKIRNKHIEVSKYFRAIFIDKIQNLFNINNIDINSEEYFHRKFFNKMYKFISCDIASKAIKEAEKCICWKS